MSKVSNVIMDYQEMEIYFRTVHQLALKQMVGIVFIKMINLPLKVVNQSVVMELKSVIKNVIMGF